MAGEATRRGDFIPFGADTMGQDRELIRQAVQAFASDQLQPDQPFAQLAQQMDLPRQSAAPQQSPQPTARPSRTSPQEPSQRTRLPRQNGEIEQRDVKPPRREREAGTGRQATRVRRSREVEGGTGELGDAPALVINSLIEAGAPPAAAAGVAGNLQQESQFDPKAVGDNGNSFGIAQWNGPRAVQLFDFARQQGENVPGLTLEGNKVQEDLESLAKRDQVPSLQTQIDFLVHEGQTTEQSAIQRVFQAATPEQAAVAASRHFFRPGDPRTERRVEFARQLADQFLGEQGQQAPQSPGLPPAQDPSRNTPAADVQGAQQDQQARVAQLLQSLAAAQQQVESSGLPSAQDPRAGPFGGGSQGAPMPPAQGDFAPQQSPIPRQPIGPNSIPPAQDTRQRTEANLAGQGGPRISASLDSEQLQQSLREFLQSGDSSTIGQLPVGQRPNFLQSLGAALRGQ